MLLTPKHPSSATLPELLLTPRRIHSNYVISTEVIAKGYFTTNGLTEEKPIPIGYIAVTYLVKDIPTCSDLTYVSSVLEPLINQLRHQVKKPIMAGRTVIQPVEALLSKAQFHLGLETLSRSHSNGVPF